MTFLGCYLVLLEMEGREWSLFNTLHPQGTKANYNSDRKLSLSTISYRGVLQNQEASQTDKVCNEYPPYQRITSTEKMDQRLENLYFLSWFLVRLTEKKPKRTYTKTLETPWRRVICVENSSRLLGIIRNPKTPNTWKSLTPKRSNAKRHFFLEIWGCPILDPAKAELMKGAYSCVYINICIYLEPNSHFFSGVDLLSYWSNLRKYGSFGF